VSDGALGRLALLVLATTGAIAVAIQLSSPTNLGYDYGAHKTYAELLVHDGHIPSPSESIEFHAPPGFYAVAGSVEAVAARLGAADPWRIARALNVLWVLGTAVLTLLMARLLFREQPLIQIAALVFVAFVPVVQKVAAMLHPEPLSLFASTLAVYLAVRALVLRRVRLGDAVLLGLVLGAAQLVRAFNLWLVPVVVAAFALAALDGVLPRRRTLVTTLVTLAAAAIVAGPWYIRQTALYSNPLAFNRPTAPGPLWDRRPLEFYTGLGLPAVFSNPTRPQYVNEVIPTVYSDVWGDYFGYFAWATTSSEATPVPPDVSVLRELKLQSVVGLVPTLLSVGGVVALIGLTLGKRVRRENPGLSVVALLPLAGVLGFLYFAVSYPSDDADVLKATYLLTTAPGWAIGFGYAWSRLSRRRFLAVPAVAACALALVADLVFLVHRGPLGPL
jgi:hypothetical protein